MRKLAFVGIILQPSVFSFFAVISIAGLLFVSSLVNFGGSNDQFFRLLLGSDSSLELIDSTKSSFEGFSDTIFSNPTLNKVLFFSFWFLVGLVVYVFLSGTGSAVGAVQKLHEDEKMLHAHKKMLERDFGIRLLLRVTAFFAWVLYTAVFFKLFVPFSMLAFQVATHGTLNFINLATGGLGAVVLLLSLHLHVVFLRCFVLRPRVVGGWDDVLAARLT